jgi:hypothetical protein
LRANRFGSGVMSGSGSTRSLGLLLLRAWLPAFAQQQRRKIHPFLSLFDNRLSASHHWCIFHATFWQAATLRFVAGDFLTSRWVIRRVLV